MERHITYFNLLDALKEKGCPICFLVKNAVNKSMDNFLYENVNDPGVRKEIRESLGYGKEGDSWIRAIEKIVGKEGI